MNLEKLSKLGFSAINAETVQRDLNSGNLGVSRSPLTEENVGSHEIKLTGIARRERKLNGEKNIGYYAFGECDSIANTNSFLNAPKVNDASALFTMSQDTAGQRWGFEVTAFNIPASESKDGKEVNGFTTRNWVKLD